MQLHKPNIFKTWHVHFKMTFKMKLNVDSKRSNKKQTNRSTTYGSYQDCLINFDKYIVDSQADPYNTVDEAMETFNKQVKAHM